MVLNYCEELVGGPPFAVIGSLFIIFGILWPQILILNLPSNKNLKDKANSISFTWRYTSSRLGLMFYVAFVVALLLNGCIRPPSLSFYFIIVFMVLVILIAHINGEIDDTYFQMIDDPVEDVRVSYKIHSMMAFTAFGILLGVNFGLLLGENEYGQFPQDQNVLAWIAQSIALLSMFLLIAEYAYNGEWTRTCSKYERLFAITCILVTAGCPKDSRQ